MAVEIKPKPSTESAAVEPKLSEAQPATEKPISEVKKPIEAGQTSQAETMGEQSKETVPPTPVKEEPVISKTKETPAVEPEVEKKPETVTPQTTEQVAPAEQKKPNWFQKLFSAKDAVEPINEDMVGKANNSDTANSSESTPGQDTTQK